MNVRESDDAPLNLTRPRRTSPGSHPLKGLPCSALQRRIGTDLAAKSAPDGYTLLVGGVSELVLNPQIVKVPYDPVRDFAAVSPLTSAYYLLVVHPSLPARSVCMQFTNSGAAAGSFTSRVDKAGDLIGSSSNRFLSSVCPPVFRESR